MKGDRGNRRSRGRRFLAYKIVVTRAGRRVEITTGRGVVDVVEVARIGGTRTSGQVHGQPRRGTRRATLAEGRSPPQQAVAHRK